MNKKPIAAACDCRVIHEDVVEKVRTRMVSPETLLETAEFFRVLGDSTRMGILHVLSNQELCGCDICALLNMSQSAVSHQLRILKQARLVRYRKVGKIVYFRLDDDHIRKIMDIGIAHVKE